MGEDIDCKCEQRENYEEEVEMILDDRLQLREIKTSAIVAQRTLQPLGGTRK